VRARELGLRIGLLAPGEHDAITDVPGVLVGHTTLIAGDGPLVVGTGPVRTGVTIVVPHEDHLWTEPVFAGCHRLNGNGELTGLEWVRESGMLGGVIGITNTHSVGVVRDALVAHAARDNRGQGVFWSLPVVGETYDGALNDIDGHHVRIEHVDAALAAASRGPVAEGNVGGGTGMILHEFKGGIGSASRRVGDADGGWTVGALVQANYGSRALLRVDGVPVGAAIPASEVPSAWNQVEGLDAGGGATPGTAGRHGPGGGSIIVVLATDAPLLSIQLSRICKRAALGIGRCGSYAAHGSGEIVIGFSTANRVSRESTDRLHKLEFLPDEALGAHYEAVIEATEEAIINSLCMAADMVGQGGNTAPGLPLDKVLELMKKYRPDRVRPG